MALAMSNGPGVVVVKLPDWLRDLSVELFCCLPFPYVVSLGIFHGGFAIAFYGHDMRYTSSQAKEQGISVWRLPCSIGRLRFSTYLALSLASRLSSYIDVYVWTCGAAAV
jgi:hypothetical protein